MITQQSSFLHHAQLSLLTNDLNKSALSHRSKWNYFPFFFLIRAYNVVFLEVEVLFSERMVNVITLLIFMVRFAGLRVGFWLGFITLSSDKSPNVILDNMICIWRATRYFIVFGQVWVRNFVSVHEIFSFKIAQSDRIVQVEQLSIWMNFG